MTPLIIVLLLVSVLGWALSPIIHHYIVNSTVYKLIKTVIRLISLVVIIILVLYVYKFVT